MENQVAGRQARRHTKNGSAAKPAVFFSLQQLYSTTQVSGKIAAETGGFRRRFKRQSALP